MTINLADNDPRTSITVSAGVTQTTFDVPFEFFDLADLLVYVDGTKKTATTDYTIASGGNGSKGVINLTVTGATGNSTVIITRDIALERTTDFQTSGPFAVASLNTELDKLIAIQADLKDSIDRSLRLTDFDADASLSLPDVDTRKGKTLAFNASNGAVEAGPSISDVQTVSAAAADIATLADIQDGTTATNAITKVAAIDSNVTTVAGIDGSVTTVAGIHGNVTSVANNTTNVDKVAAIDANVTKVANIDSNVTTVAGIDTEIQAVANDATDIGAVAAKSTEIGRLGTADAVADLAILGTTAAVADMNTLANISTEIAAVGAKASLITSDFVSDLNTLAVTDVINDINTLATSDIVSDLNTLATSDIVSDINTLATSDIVSDLNTLATSDFVSDLNTMATSDVVADLNTLAAISSDITSLAGALEKTYTVTVTNPGSGNVFVLDGSNAPTIELFRGNTYVFDQSDNSNTGHPIAFKDSGGSSYTDGVTSTGTPGSSGAKTTFVVPSNAPSSLRYYCTVHGNGMGNTITVTDSNISLVAGSIANVNLTGNSISNVNNVAGALTNINTTANNISGINSFAERYRVGSSDPTSSLDEGDLAYNSTSNLLKYYNGSSWQSISPGIGSVADDSSPQLGGSLDVNGNSIVSTSNGNIAITPNGTGSVVIDGLSHPQSDGSAGQFMKTDGSGQLSFATVNTDLSNDTSPQLGGDLFTNTHQIRLGDASWSNQENILHFGASNDLSIYHDGNNSWIYESGTGNLYIQGYNLYVRNGNGAVAFSAFGGTSGKSYVYYQGATRLGTDADGVEVFGTAKADTLKIDNNTTSGSDWEIEESSNNLIFKYNGTSVGKLDTSGNLTVIGNVTAFGTI